jgi:hypothetical protein
LNGYKKGFPAEARQVAPHVNFIYCIINREALVSRDLKPQCVTRYHKVVNFVQSRPLKSRLFARKCRQTTYHFYCIRRLGGYQETKVLKRLVELKGEVRMCLRDSDSQLYQHFLDDKWHEIFSYFNGGFRKVCVSLT